MSHNTLRTRANFLLALFTSQSTLNLATLYQEANMLGSHHTSILELQCKDQVTKVVLHYQNGWHPVNCYPTDTQSYILHFDLQDSSCMQRNTTLILSHIPYISIYKTVVVCKEHNTCSNLWRWLNSLTLSFAGANQGYPGPGNIIRRGKYIQ